MTHIRQQSNSLTQKEIETRLEEYAAWVSKLRNGDPIQALPTGGADPLSRLARELDQLAATLVQREREVRRLFDLIETVEQGVLIEEVLDRIFDGFIGVIPFDRLGCAFLSSDGEHLTAFWARTNLGAPLISKGYTKRLSGSSLEPLFKTGTPRILNDLEAYLEKKPDSDATRRIVEEGGRSSLTCPLSVNGKPVGVLFFTSRHKETYKELHQAVFRQIASQLSVIIGKSRHYEEILEHNRALSKQSRELEEIASRDALTGVLNRGAIMNALKADLAQAVGRNKSIGVILADIDYFKQINDTLGHPAGDKTLKIFVARLKAALRPDDRIGRFGGEEFLVVLTDMTRSALMKTAERLRNTIASEPFDLDVEKRAVTASFGAAFAKSEDTPEAAISEADRALYEAKRGGRNKVVLIDGAPHAAENRRDCARLMRTTRRIT